jgi:hypothetical protein
MGTRAMTTQSPITKHTYVRPIVCPVQRPPAGSIAGGSDW